MHRGVVWLFAIYFYILDCYTVLPRSPVTVPSLIVLVLLEYLEKSYKARKKYNLVAFLSHVIEANPGERDGTPIPSDSCNDPS